MMVLMAMALLRPLSVMLIFLHHFHLYGSNALLVCFTASKLISFMQMQLLQFFLEAGQWHTTLQKRSQKHIATDARKTIQIYGFHNNLPSVTI